MNFPKQCAFFRLHDVWRRNYTAQKEYETKNYWARPECKWYMLCTYICTRAYTHRMIEE